MSIPPLGDAPAIFWSVQSSMLPPDPGIAQEAKMNVLRTLLFDFAASDGGGQMIEYALIGALVAVASVTAMTNFGKKDLLKLYTNIGTDFKKDVK